MEKKINYLARNFEDIKSELINFSNKYYPEITDDFNDSSVGSWFIDLMSAVGDDLSYHTDRMFQETNINSANLKSTLLNIARTNGIKVPGKKASMCEVEVSVVLPVSSQNIAQPNWDYAPILMMGSIVSAGNYNFEIIEDVNFAEQFNKHGVSNREIIANRDTNGNISSYTIKKTVIARNGNTRVYKKVITRSDLQPFMDFVLPETNVMNVESIIFKETSDYTDNPKMSEYYIDAEEYRLGNEAVTTYRFFECNSLAEQYRWGTKVNYSGNTDIIQDRYNPEIYDDYTETTVNGTTRTSRYYRGEWKPLTQKFITEYTDNGYLKIIFGAGIKYDSVPDLQTTYADYEASKIINNDMLGVLPKEGWTMFILYRVGGGAETNLGPGSINAATTVNFEFGNVAGLDGRIKGNVIQSLSVTNVSTAVSGKDAPSAQEIKYIVKYNAGAQERCVTLKDYKARLSEMPAKYGSPFRSMVIENNNKIEMSFLGMNADRKLDASLPQTLVENVINYLEGYKSLNDYIEIKSGKIYNVGFSVDVFIDKNYNTSDVINSIISIISNYMDINNHDMGEDIFIGDLEKSISQLDGVINLIDLRVWNIYNGIYSTDKCPLPRYTESSVCGQSNRLGFKLNTSNSFAEELDLNASDKVLYGDYNSMYEIFNTATDIQVRAKIK